MHRSDEELEGVIRAFLRRIGLEFQACPDLMTIINKLKVAIPGFDYARVPDRQMPEAEAQWDSEKQLLRMRESVFQAMQRGEARARMSIAHELCHYIFRHQGVLNRSVVKTISERAVPRVRHAESEARRAAAVLLAPEHLVPDDVSVDALIDVFNLSNEAALFRKEEIDGIRRRRRNEPRPLPSTVVDYLEEARRRGLLPRR
jgi:hypothetical protein